MWQLFQLWHGSRYGDYKKSLIICSRKVEGRKGPLPKSKHCQCFDMVKITLRKDEYGYVEAMWYIWGSITNWKVWQWGRTMYCESVILILNINKISLSFCRHRGKLYSYTERNGHSMYGSFVRFKLYKNKDVKAIKRLRMYIYHSMKK